MSLIAQIDKAHPLSQGLAAWWVLNEGAGLRQPDLTGRYDAYAPSGATAPGWVSGALGKARSFSAAAGTNISVASVNPLTATTNISLCAWVYISGTSTKGAFIANGNPATQADGFAIGVGSTDFDTNGNNLVGLLPGVAWLNFGIAIGTGWHFVVMTRDTATWRGYVDGVVSGTTFSNNPNAPSVGFGVGLLMAQEGALTSRSFTGNMSNVRLYNRCLTPSDISRLYVEPFAGLIRLRRPAVANAGVTVALTGVAGTGAVGTLGVNRTTALSGVAATGAVGTVVPSLALALTGVEGLAAVGDVGIGGDKTVALTGVEATGAVGDVVAVLGGVSGTLRRRGRYRVYRDVPVELAPAVDLAAGYVEAEVERAVEDAMRRLRALSLKASVAQRTALVQELNTQIVAAVARAAEADEEDAIAALL